MLCHKKEPSIAERLTVILIGGGAYPKGGLEPNICQDITAARILFSFATAIWQILQNAYCTVEISLSEVTDEVMPCGRIGEYLCEEVLFVNDFYTQAPFRMDWPHGETWCLGDNPTVAVLFEVRIE